MSGGLQNCMDLGETVPCVCGDTCVTLSADGSDIRAEEDRLAVLLPVVKADDKVCYECNIIVLTVVRAYTG